MLSIKSPGNSTAGRQMIFEVLISCILDHPTDADSDFVAVMQWT
jgi:hypothetical protein